MLTTSKLMANYFKEKNLTSGILWQGFSQECSAVGAAEKRKRAERRRKKEDEEIVEEVEDAR